MLAVNRLRLPIFIVRSGAEKGSKLTSVTARAPDGELSTEWHLRTRHRRLAAAVIASLLLSLALAGLILKFEFLPVLAMAAVIIVTVVIWRPTLGLFTIFGLVMALEDGGFDPLMQPAHHLYMGVAGAVVTPIELLLILTFTVWLAQTVAGRRGADFRGGALWRPIALFALALLVGLARGASSGGDMYFGMWEARGLSSLLCCYFITANSVRTRRDVQTLLAILLVATALFAIEGAYRRMALINTGAIGGGDEVYGHEDAVFLGVALLLVLIQQILGGPRWLRFFGVLVVPVLIFTLFASQRRAGMIGTMVAFLVFSLVFLVTHRGAFFKVALPMLLVGAVYLPLFWNNTSLVGQPARSVRSLFEPNARDASSNEARVQEKINVRATIEGNQIMGVGFGGEYWWVVPLPVIKDWPLQHYVSHHNILWVWLKTGAAGFALFWLLMGSAVSRGAHLARKLTDPTLRSFAFVALGALVSALLYCAVDTGLTTTRLTIFLGVVMGALAVLDRIPLADARKPC